MSPTELKLAKAQEEPKNKVMPDVAETTGAAIQGTLDRVGMSEIEVPVQIKDVGQTLNI